MHKLVMVISDENERELLTLKKAKQLAASFEADVEVVRFLPKTCNDTARQSAVESIGELLESVFSDRASVTSQVVPTDSISDWVVDHCADDVDSLVLKTGHRSESLFHTPTDWELIRNLHGPLLISAGQKWKSQPNILIAVDLSTDEAEHQALNAMALQWAKQWQAMSGYQLHAAYSIPISAPLLALDIVEERDFLRNHEPEAKAKLVALLKGVDLIATPHILAGAPEKTIPHLANELKSDLVIMGSVGREGLPALLHGNTAEKVLHHLRTDILVVKPTVGL